MQKIILLLLTILLAFGHTVTGLAQASIQVDEIQINYDYGDQITFHARFLPVEDIQEAFLFFQVEGDSETRSILLPATEDGRTEYRYTVSDSLIRPFARVFFWYRVSLTDGGVFDSPRYFFQYDDNRYPWQVLEDDQVRVHWYGGDSQFGEQAFASTHIGLQNLEGLIPVDPDYLPVDIFIYSSGDDIEETLRLGGYAWTAGHASPELGVVLVAVNPDEAQAAELTSEIPHELAHVILYRTTGNTAATLPVWLSEGVASLAGGKTNDDYLQVLETARANDTLIPMSELCGAFPIDASSAILSYAQATSFTQYLRDSYGTAGIHDLVTAYMDGQSCEDGSRYALGQPLSQLERQWRQTVLGENAGPAAIGNLMPYVILLLFIFLYPTGYLVYSFGRRRSDRKDTA